MKTLKEENENLRRENERLRKKIERAKKEESDNSAWDFHWDGRGSYEEARRCFYGDFS